MTAKEQSLTFIGSEQKITIPFFQRGYVWDKTNWEDLIEELLNFRRNHFLGSLIMKQMTLTTGGQREVLVIDGQQRLTTLSVLIKVLYDLFPPEVQVNATAAFRTYLFYKKDQLDPAYHIKIHHSHVDSHSYRQVMDSNNLHHQAQLEAITTSSNRILQCYKFFIEYLRGQSDDIRKNLFNTLLNDNNKLLVVIDLFPQENEQAIFDTINSAGVRLSSADIIKNALFQRVLTLLKTGQPDEETRNQRDAVELYDSTWRKTFLLDEPTIQFWDTDRPTGRLMRDNIEILLHCYATIKGFYDPDRNTLAELGDLFKAAIDEKSTLDQIKDMIREICDYAVLYREHIASFDSTSLLSFDDHLCRLLHILDAQQITTFHPFILHVLKTVPAEPDRDATFNKLERFLVRRMIAGAETKSYNKTCKEFLSDPAKLDAKATDQSNDKVLSGIRKIDNKSARLLLFWIELYRRHTDPKFDVKELKYSYSLEHIMPQKWEQYWTNLPQKTNTDKSLMTPEQAKRDRSEKVYYIGNMTLLTTNLNSSLRNYTFDKKMDGDGRKKGIKQYAALSVTQHDIVRPYDAGDKVWDESKINARTESLGKEVLIIW
jgi:hypothetical protein